MIKQDGISHINEVVTQQKQSGMMQSILLLLLLIIIISCSRNSSSSSIQYQQIPMPILFANDTSILITSPNYIQFQSDFNIVFGQLNKWFKANLLSLNLAKLISFYLLTKVHVLLTYKLCMKINLYSYRNKIFWADY